MRPSTTSSPTADRAEASESLRALIDRLPEPLRLLVFTHASWVQRREDSYERLEFLGDGVLGLAIAHHMYERFPERAEGDLAKVRAHVVSRQSCATVAIDLGLDRDLRARGAQLGTAAVEIDSLAGSAGVLAAIVEAVVGATYLHFGLGTVTGAVVQAFSARIEYALAEHVDHKTVLQEELARRGASVTYAVADVSGPPHQRWFTSVALVEGHELGRGSARSKKASEQHAAHHALESLDRTSTPA
ncbi:MAG: ribonuclease III domain-containing protein [Gaiellales bacterium]